MNKKEFNQEVGKYLLDVSKLIFGGGVLATILKIEEINRGVVLISGLSISVIIALIGFNILNKK